MVWRSGFEIAKWNARKEALQPSNHASRNQLSVSFRAKLKVDDKHCSKNRCDPARPVNNTFLLESPDLCKTPSNTRSVSCRNYRVLTMTLSMFEL